MPDPLPPETPSLITTPQAQESGRKPGIFDAQTLQWGIITGVIIVLLVAVVTFLIDKDIENVQAFNNLSNLINQQSAKIDMLYGMVNNQKNIEVTFPQVTK